MQPNTPGTSPAPPTGQLQTFTLAVPITDDAGQSYASVTLCEPTLKHASEVEKRGLSSGPAQNAAMFAALSGVPEPAILKMKLRDARQIKQWLNATERRGIVADMATELTAAEAAPVDGDGPALETSRTFTLLVPVTGVGSNAGGPLTQITLREPDLEAGIATSKFAGEAQQTAALIATLSGLTIPVVMKMKSADIARLERWLDFFSEAGASSPAAPVTAESDLPAAPVAGAPSPSSLPAN